MKRVLGQIDAGTWIAKDSAGSTVAALASASDGAQSVKEFYASLRNGPKFPFDPMDFSSSRGRSPQGSARWDEATLKAWAKGELGNTPDATYNAKASW